MKLFEIASPVKQVVGAISHSPIRNKKKGKLIKKYLRRQKSKVDYKPDLDGALPVSGGMFSGLF